MLLASTIQIVSQGFDFEVGQPFTVFGRVVNEVGQPVSGLSISASDGVLLSSRNLGTTTPLGYFSLDYSAAQTQQAGPGLYLIRVATSDGAAIGLVVNGFLPGTPAYAIRDSSLTYGAGPSVRAEVPSGFVAPAANVLDGAFNWVNSFTKAVAKKTTSLLDVDQSGGVGLADFAAVGREIIPSVTDFGRDYFTDFVTDRSNQVAMGLALSGVGTAPALSYLAKSAFKQVFVTSANSIIDSLEGLGEISPTTAETMHQAVLAADAIHGAIGLDPKKGIADAETLLELIGLTDTVGELSGRLLYDVLNNPLAVELTKTTVRDGRPSGMTAFSILLPEALRPVPTPLVEYVTPNLRGRPVPQRQQLIVRGRGFLSNSLLEFHDGTTTYPNRIPAYVRQGANGEPDEIGYNIAVGNRTRDWTVRVINGTHSSQPFPFSVTAQTDDGAPAAPINLTAAYAGGFAQNLYTVNWTNPSDSSGIQRVWYKLGAAPTSPADGLKIDADVGKPLWVYSPASDDTLHVWLEDGAGNKDHTHTSTVLLSANPALPVVRITGPTAEPNMTTGSGVISLSGTAVNLASSLQSIRWSNSRGGSGSIAVRDAWASPPIQLLEGTNVLRIDATDHAGATATDTVTVSYTPPVVTKTWTGASSADSSNPANWSPVGVPTGADTVAINGGTINLASGLAAANLFLNQGTLNWSGGTILARTTVAAGAVLNVSGPQDKRWAGTLNNAGTVNWSGTGVVRLGDWNFTGMTFNNLAGGVFEASGDALMMREASNDPHTFNNAGTFRKSGGTGATELRSVIFNNTGAVEAQSGTLSFSSFMQSTGMTHLSGTITSSSPLDIRGGVFAGNGIIGGSVVNGASLRPGSSPGVLTINGTFTQSSSGHFSAELDGQVAGTGYDQIVVNGPVSVSGQLSVSLGVVPAEGQTFTIIDNDGNDAIIGTFAELPEGAILSVNGRRLRITYVGGTGNDVVLAAIDPAAVFGRRTFYNNSAFDGRTMAATDGDVTAVATDKHALTPGGVASFANVTNYSKGINGIILDVGGLPLGSDPTDADFTFKVGRGGDPASWAVGPQPTSIIVRRGAGTGGSDRILLTWADGAIRNTWLQVTLKANAATGLKQSDVFYFGNLIGETGDPRTPLGVSAHDLVAARRAISSRSVPITNVYDVNRDGRVNAIDYATVRNNVFRSLAPVATGIAMAGDQVGNSALRMRVSRRAAWIDGSDAVLAT